MGYDGGRYLKQIADAMGEFTIDGLQAALSIRNLADHSYLPPEGVNVYDLLRHDHLIVSKAAAKALEARCLEGQRAGNG